MTPDAMIRQEVLDLGTSGAVGAAPQTIAGNAVDLREVKDGVLKAILVGQAKTNTLTMTARWQAQDKAGAWHNVAHGTQNAAGVALATGTGSAVAFDVILVSPPLQGYRKARLVVVTGAASATAVDDTVTKLAYSYERAGF